MTSRDFVYWLQGYIEIGSAHDRLGNNMGLTPDQVAVIAKYLALVFIHEIDPSMPNKKLDEVHHTGISDDKMVYRC